MHNTVEEVLVAFQPLSFLTIADYLAFERVADARHEYLDGHVYAMGGESLAHGHISVNLVALLHGHLRQGPCQVFTKAMKVWCPAPRQRTAGSGLFAYPDLVVVCGDHRYHDQHRDILMNPTVLIEVVSPTTEGYDRGEKSRRYRFHLPTLQAYILLAQDQPVLDQYHRPPGTEAWQWEEITGLEASLHVAALDWTVALTDIYERVVFEAADA
jgi:Uma2 family endonuclease